MDGEKVGAVKVIPVDGCYLHVRFERLLGSKRKTANAFRTGWVTNTPTIHLAAYRGSVGTTQRRDDAGEKHLQILKFARLHGYHATAPC